MQDFDKEGLFSFIDRAAKATYAGGGKEQESPERPGFIELTYSEGALSYRDSYTGYNRSRGMEVVRFKDKPIWTASYGGGMVEGRESLANHCFDFLKKCMSEDEEGFQSFRGPHSFKYGDWSYAYSQEGDVFEFSGSEEIKYKGELVFFHKIIGGLIKGKDA